MLKIGDKHYKLQKTYERSEKHMKDQRSIVKIREAYLRSEKHIKDQRSIVKIREA